jgi:hypothetical protein
VISLFLPIKEKAIRNVFISPKGAEESEQRLNGLEEAAEKVA